MATTTRVNFNSSRLDLEPQDSWLLLPADQPDEPLLSEPFDLAFTREPGASISFSFYGSELNVLGVLSPNASSFRADLDGVQQEFTPCKPTEATQDQQMFQLVNLGTEDEHTLTLTHAGSEEEFLGIQALVIQHAAPSPVYIPSGPGARHTTSHAQSKSKPAFPLASTTVTRHTKKSHGHHSAAHSRYAGKASATAAFPFAPTSSTCPSSSSSNASSSSSSSSHRSSSSSSEASTSSPSSVLNTQTSKEPKSSDPDAGLIAGASVGGVAALVLLGLLAALALRRHRRAQNRSSVSSSATDPAFVSEAVPATRPQVRRAVTDSSWIGFAGDNSDFSHTSEDHSHGHDTLNPEMMMAIPQASPLSQNPPSDEEADLAAHGMPIAGADSGEARRLSRAGTMTDPFRRNAKRQLSVRNPDMTNFSVPSASAVSNDSPRFGGYRPSMAESVDSERSWLDRLPAHTGVPAQHSDSQASLGTPMEVQDVAFGLDGANGATTVTRRLSYF